MKVGFILVHGAHLPDIRHVDLSDHQAIYYVFDGFLGDARQHSADLDIQSLPAFIRGVPVKGGISFYDMLYYQVSGVEELMRPNPGEGFEFAYMKDGPYQTSVSINNRVLELLKSLEVSHPEKVLIDHTLNDLIEQVTSVSLIGSYPNMMSHIKAYLTKLHTFPVLCFGLDGQVYNGVHSDASYITEQTEFEMIESLAAPTYTLESLLKDVGSQKTIVHGIFELMRQALPYLPQEMPFSADALLEEDQTALSAFAYHIAQTLPEHDQAESDLLAALKKLS